jgi:hypothetical protein
VLALQWAVGWRYLLANRRCLLSTVAVPVAYLRVADSLAISDEPPSVESLVRRQR